MTCMIQKRPNNGKWVKSSTTLSVFQTEAEGAAASAVSPNTAYCFCSYESVLPLQIRIAATNPYCCYEVQVMEYIHAEKDDNIDCRGV